MGNSKELGETTLVIGTDNYWGTRSHPYKGKLHLGPVNDTRQEIVPSQRQSSQKAQGLLETRDPVTVKLRRDYAESSGCEGPSKTSHDGSLE
jgi:hypothetical protein